MNVSTMLKITYNLFCISAAGMQNKTPNLSNYFGSVTFNKDALAIQKEMRDEWD